MLFLPQILTPEHSPANHLEVVCELVFRLQPEPKCAFPGALTSPLFL